MRSSNIFHRSQGWFMAVLAGALMSVAGGTRAEPLVGEVVLYAGANCPAGWLQADGATYKETQYPELYAALGTTHCASVGGCVAGDFALPNLKGRFPRGVLPGSTAAGDIGGAAVSAANLPAHTHSLDGVELSGRVVATTLEGDTEVPSSTTTLGDSNRTAIYKAGTPNTGLAAGSAVVTGDANTNTLPAYDGSPGDEILPPHVSMQYCVAAGGDTAPLIEVGLQYVEDLSFPTQGSLVPVRVDVSGFTPTAGNAGDCFVDGNGDVSGNLCLADLAAANPGIGRPNIRFKLVGENACTARARYCFFAGSTSTLGCSTIGWETPYAGELTLTGVQVARIDDPNNPPAKSAIPWGNDQFVPAVGSSRDFTYTLQQDEQLNYGFVAVDSVDERTLVLEARNINSNKEYAYRLQAKCGDQDVPIDLDGNGFPDSEGGQTTTGAYYIYYDPSIRNDGRGGGTTY